MTASPVLLAFMGGCVAAGATAIGTLPALFASRIAQRTQDAMFGFGAGVMLAGSGRLTGFAAVRDSATVTYQNQLDEIARGLIEAFAESDQSASPSLPDVPGLFTYPGSPAIPA